MESLLEPKTTRSSRPVRPRVEPERVPCPIEGVAHLLGLTPSRSGAEIHADDEREPRDAARASALSAEGDAGRTALLLAGLDRAWAQHGGDTWDQDTPIPEGLLQAVARAGLFACSLPAVWGGLGLSLQGQLAVTDWVARRSPSLGVLLGVQTGLALRSLVVGGALEQPQHQPWLADLAWGRRWGCYALTEPERGSDAQHILTEACPTGDGGWTLWGEKFWIGNAHRADVAIVFAQVRPSSDAPDAPHGMTAFVVPTDRAGFQVPAVFDKLGIRGSTQGWIRLEGVHVTPRDVLGTIGQGFRIATLALNTGRLTLGTGAVAGMEEMLRLATRRLVDREQFGAALLERAPLRDRTDAILCRAQGLRALQQRVAHQAATAAQLKDWAIEAACLKVLASDGLWEASDWALQVWGGRGFCKEWPIERAWRDARINRIFEGANEALTTWVGFQVAQRFGRHLRAQSAPSAILRLSPWGRSRTAATIAAPYADAWGTAAAAQLEDQIAAWLEAVGRLMRRAARLKTRPEVASGGAPGAAAVPGAPDDATQRLERLAAWVGAQTMELLVLTSLTAPDQADAAEEGLHRLAQLQRRRPRKDAAREQRARTRITTAATRYDAAWSAAQRAQRPTLQPSFDGGPPDD